MADERYRDENGYTSGYSNDKGTIFDQNGQYKGYTDEKGTIYDSNHHTVGYTGADGTVYDKNHQIIGHKDASGVFYNENYQRSDYMDMFSQNGGSHHSANSAAHWENNNDSGETETSSEALAVIKIVACISIFVTLFVGLFNLRLSVTATFFGCNLVHLCLLTWKDAYWFDILLRAKKRHSPYPQKDYKIMSTLVAFDFLAIVISSLFVFLVVMYKVNVLREGPGAGVDIIPTTYFCVASVVMLYANFFFHGLMKAKLSEHPH